MQIVLVGYMGSGKTSIGKKLAKKLEIDFIDLDDYIEEREGSTINKIFSEKGEIYFRKLENKLLKTLLNSKNDFILAVGGGTPCYANNINLINEASIAVYLKASIQKLYDKLRLKKDKRPLIKDLEDHQLKEFIAKHLFERTPFYEKAQIIINTDGKKKKEVAHEIMTSTQ